MVLYHGTLECFSPKLGYGFIAFTDGTEDKHAVLVRSSNFLNFSGECSGSLSQEIPLGSSHWPVTFEISVGPLGSEAVKVASLCSNADEPSPPKRSCLTKRCSGDSGVKIEIINISDDEIDKEISVASENLASVRKSRPGFHEGKILVVKPDREGQGGDGLLISNGNCNVGFTYSKYFAAALFQAKLSEYFRAGEDCLIEVNSSGEIIAFWSASSNSSLKDDVYRMAFEVDSIKRLSGEIVYLAPSVHIVAIKAKIGDISCGVKIFLCEDRCLLCSLRGFNFGLGASATVVFGATSWKILLPLINRFSIILPTSIRRVYSNDTCTISFSKTFKIGLDKLDKMYEMIDCTVQSAPAWATPGVLCRAVVYCQTTATKAKILKLARENEPLDCSFGYYSDNELQMWAQQGFYFGTITAFNTTTGVGVLFGGSLMAYSFFASRDLHSKLDAGSRVAISLSSSRRVVNSLECHEVREVYMI